jgi:amino acid permease
MDSIDITSAEFSLDRIPDINEVISTSIYGENEYTLYIYIAIAIIVLVIGFLIYKFYNNKQKHVTFEESNNTVNEYYRQ